MSRRSRTGDVDLIATPDERPAQPAGSRAGFDINDIDSAIGDLTADVQGGPVNAVELPSTMPSGSASPILAGIAEVEAGFGPTDEQLAVPQTDPHQQHGPPVPPPAAPAYAQSAAPPPYAPASAPPPYAQPSAPPPYAQPSAPSSAPPADPFAGGSAPPAGRPIQNEATAYVRNPLLSPRPPAPVPASAPPDPYASTAGQPEVGAPPRGRLVVQGGDWNGTTWYLNRAETRLGRGEENDIVVLDIGVSRNHLVLVRHVEGFRLVDLQSGNGTYVNGRRVMETELYDGDRVDLGHTSLVFATQGEPRLRPPGTAEYGAGRRLPTSWLVIMALTTFFTVLGTMYLVRSLKDDGPPPAVLAVQEAVANQDWTAAKAAVEAARAEGVDEAELGELPGRIEQEAAARARIEQAQPMVMGAVPADDALKLPEKLEAVLGEIPPGSMYYPESRSLLQQGRQLRVNAMLDEAERLLEGGQSVRARLRVREALEEDPANARAKALRRQLDQLENR